MAAVIRYSIFPSHPEAHLFEVRCTVADPDPAGQVFSLPAWIPGSYLIREFSKNVVRIRAQSGRKMLAMEKPGKNAWRIEPCQGAVTVTIEVYAWDMSVRGAHLDTTHAFFNGPSMFLRVDGRENTPCEVEILPPRGARYRTWRVATAMRRKGAKAYGFGTYQAADYDELIDHPVETGSFTLATFRACGVPHDIAITGRHRADMARLARDLKTLCETQIRFFGEPAPMQRYVFLVTAIGEGYGGLEHRDSTALLCSMLVASACARSTPEPRAEALEAINHADVVLALGARRDAGATRRRVADTGTGGLARPVRAPDRRRRADHRCRRRPGRLAPASPASGRPGGALSARDLDARALRARP